MTSRRQGCGHAGIVNTILHGLEPAEAEKPLAAIGGFHLCRPMPVTVVRRTLDDLKQFNPDFLVPYRCIGWGGFE